MKPFNRILLSCLFMSMIAVPCFSQKDEKSEPSKTAGLRKIAGGSGLQNLNIEVDIDEKTLKSSVESSVETAMRSLEVALDNMEIHFEAMEINLREMNFDVAPMIITIPEMDFDLHVDDSEFDYRDDNGSNENVNDNQSFDNDENKNKDKDKNK
jgi:hypothetical protein